MINSCCCGKAIAVFLEPASLGERWREDEDDGEKLTGALSLLVTRFSAKKGALHPPGNAVDQQLFESLL